MKNANFLVLVNSICIAYSRSLPLAPPPPPHQTPSDKLSIMKYDTYI